MGRIRTSMTVGGGLVGLLVVAALYLAPELVFGFAPEAAAAVGELDPSLSLLLVAVLLFLLGVLKWLAGRLTGDARPTQRTESRAETRSLYATGAGGLEPFGAAVDERFRAAVDYEGTGDAARRQARNVVVSELRAAATTAYAQETGHDRDHAEAAVDSGEWTDDRRAAGLLSDEEGPSIPVSRWLLDLLLGRDPFVEGVERSIEAIGALHGDREEARGGRSWTLFEGVSGR